MLQRLLNRFYNRHVDGMTTIMGLDCAGKTTLLYRLVLGEVIQTIPTIGLNVETIKVPTSSGRKLLLTFMDIGIGCGMGFFVQVVTPYTAYSDTIIWVVDSSDAERLDESAKLLSSLIKRANTRPTPSKDKECPILM
jgi:GTPase SAR1 family protein